MDVLLVTALAEYWRRIMMAAMRLGAIDLLGTGTASLPRKAACASNAIPTFCTGLGLTANFPGPAKCLPVGWTANRGTNAFDVVGLMTVGLAMPVGGRADLGLATTTGVRGGTDPVARGCGALRAEENRCLGCDWVFNAAGIDWLFRYVGEGVNGRGPTKHKIHTELMCVVQEEDLCIDCEIHHKGAPLL